MTLEFNSSEYPVIMAALANRKERVQEMLRIFEDSQTAQNSYKKELRQLEELELRLHNQLYGEGQY